MRTHARRTVAAVAAWIAAAALPLGLADGARAQSAAAPTAAATGAAAADAALDAPPAAEVRRRPGRDPETTILVPALPPVAVPAVATPAPMPAVRTVTPEAGGAPVPAQGREASAGAGAAPPARADAATVRIKDLATVQGVRSNQLVGYGLVVGLDGSGDQTSQAPFTTQSLRNWLAQLGITLPPGVNPQLKNVAAVAVTAMLPPFAKPGQTLDVTINSVGNAKSLRGGTLLATPLRGLDGAVYGIAQGNLVVNGFGASAQDGSRLTVNVPTSGRIPNGATVERAVPASVGAADSLTLALRAADFTTAARMAERINRELGPESAVPLDATSVRVQAPANPAQRVAFVSYLENLDFAPGDAPARVIINSRTGTVVIGSHVRVSPAAVSHGSLTVSIREDVLVSQPGPLAQRGDTVVAPDSAIEAEQTASRMFLFAPGVTLDEIVRAVNQVGAAPGDLVAILEALQQAGALRAELMVI